MGKFELIPLQLTAGSSHLILLVGPQKLPFRTIFVVLGTDKICTGSRMIEKEENQCES
jgi:hypothetical protein